MDILFICTTILFVLFGFFIIIPQPQWSSILCLILACITFLPCLYHPYYLSYNHQIDIIDYPLQQNYGFSLYKKECYSRRLNMSISLTICMCLYPLNYLIALFYNYINPSFSIIFYLILTLITKLMFTLGNEIILYILIIQFYVS